jgi:ribosomal protein L37AE/L43A
MNEKNSRLHWKEDLPATCPHCGHTSEYCVYLNVWSIYCHGCDKEFDVGIYTSNVELKAM